MTKVEVLEKRIEGLKSSYERAEKMGDYVRCESILEEIENEEERLYNLKDTSWMERTFS